MILTSPTTDAHGATKLLAIVKPRSWCRFITGRCFRSANFTAHVSPGGAQAAVECTTVEGRGGGGEKPISEKQTG